MALGPRLLLSRGLLLACVVLACGACGHAGAFNLRAAASAMRRMAAERDEETPTLYRLRDLPPHASAIAFYDPQREEVRAYLDAGILCFKRAPQTARFVVTCPLASPASPVESSAHVQTPAP